MHASKETLALVFFQRTQCMSPASSALNNHGYVGLRGHNHIFKRLKEPASAEGLVPLPHLGVLHLEE